jgi:osmotically inducible lipoprotein OsmB
MFKRNTTIIAGMAALTLTVGACAYPLTTRERTTLGGAALGAGTGALIGHAAKGKPAEGALIGGAAGALGGALIGNEIDRRDRYYYD